MFSKCKPSKPRKPRLSSVVHRLSSIVFLFVFCGLFTGCGSDLLTGIGIGAGTSAGLTEAQKMAQESKAVLIAELAATKEKLSQASEPAEVKALENKLSTLEKKQDVVEITEQVTGKITEGLAKDWQTKDPTKQTENIQWIVGAGMGAWALWNKRRQLAAEKTLTRIEGESDPATAKKIYDIHKDYKKKVIA
jgi:hypothetical protein